MAKPQCRPRLKYRIDYPDEAGENVTEILTEQQILDTYWNYWHGKMSAKFGPNDPQITKQNCINDWIVVNWAVEIK